MNTALLPRQLPLIGFARRVLTLRVLFVATVLYGGLLFWIAPRPPLVDLPQHAAQVAMLHDLVLGRSPWHQMMRINLFTPYLFGYLFALPFTLVMSVGAALKLTLTLSYYTFVFACVLLRRRFDGDARLDWLFVPGFFGLAWQWGFYTFVVATPLGLLYLLLALRHADRPTRSTSFWLCLAGTALFFAHGLVFLVANAIGGLFVLVRARGRKLPTTLLALVPYAALILLCAAYVVANHNAQSAYAADVPTFLQLQIVHRVASILMFTWGAGFDYRWPMIVATLLVLAAAHRLGLRLNRREPAAFVPLGVLLAMWAFVPSSGMSTHLLYERFALYVLPFYALVFVRREQADDVPGARQRRDFACQGVLALVCIVFFGIQTRSLLNFAKESASFETVLAAAEPAQRALILTMDPVSPAAGNPLAYMHYAAWYQADKQGLVDYNFADSLAQAVRYRERRTLSMSADRLAWLPDTFDWKNDHGDQYRYFFVRTSGALPHALLTNPVCPLTVAQKSGDWILYENRQCH
ncbi:hypothetical protein [Paraburkholderia unamae]|jgi:hypothetical protein|uniref:Uncharacterized protein n=1 Tax=Paraburkholderia unamae TaxID=219649 RepID=A0ABX5KLU4_9BURK|nr:hypothetical protein [Paraburkholderia unamae]PVX82227.1 hypothetical protein C7402_10980 [Paraburkholderia unamae]RAR60556.1 hypothetical protein C7401_10979 [Paraburkholderia unamae]CAG9272288.1 conserved membrane hypothetical protein [Paraburkholderia unamae]